MSRAWSVDNHRVEWVGGQVGLFGSAAHLRGKLFIDGVRDETCQVKFNRPNHELKVGSRHLVLKTNGFEGDLWCRGVMIPPTAEHVGTLVAPAGSSCAKHPEAAASIACAKCGTFACHACEGVDATHCAACMCGVTEAEASAAVLASAPSPFALMGRRLLWGGAVLAVAWVLRALVG